MTDEFLSPDAMTEQYVHWFRNSAPYINAHRGKTFVLMFGGEAVNHDNFRNIIHDIALLHSLGISLVLVHAGWQCAVWCSMELQAHRVRY